MNFEFGALKPSLPLPGGHARVLVVSNRRNFAKKGLHVQMLVRQFQRGTMKVEYGIAVVVGFRTVVQSYSLPLSLLPRTSPELS